MREVGAHIATNQGNSLILALRVHWAKILRSNSTEFQHSNNIFLKSPQTSHKKG